MPSSASALAGDELEEGGLAGAVDAHHAPALAAANEEVHPVVDDLLAVRLAHLIELHHVVARARRRLEVEAKALGALGRLEALDLLELLHPRLHLRGVAGAGFEASDESFFLGEHRLLTVDRALRLDVEERPLLDVVLVVAAEDGQLAAVDLDDLADDAVHELAIVRGEDERAVVVLEERLEPDDRLDVEMVRGLVEEHRVGAHQEDAGEGDAHLPAARERADVAVHRLLREAETGEDLARLGVERVAAELLEPRLRLAERLDQLVHLAPQVSGSASCASRTRILCPASET